MGRHSNPDATHSVPTRNLLHLAYTNRFNNVFPHPELRDGLDQPPTPTKLSILARAVTNYLSSNQWERYPIDPDIQEDRTTPYVNAVGGIKDFDCFPQETGITLNIVTEEAPSYVRTSLVALAWGDEKVTRVITPVRRHRPFYDLLVCGPFFSDTCTTFGQLLVATNFLAKAVGRPPLARVDHTFQELCLRQLSQPDFLYTPEQN